MKFLWDPPGIGSTQTTAATRSYRGGHNLFLSAPIGSACCCRSALYVASNEWQNGSRMLLSGLTTGHVFVSNIVSITKHVMHVDEEILLTSQSPTGLSGEPEGPGRHTQSINSSTPLLGLLSEVLCAETVEREDSSTSLR